MTSITRRSSGKAGRRVEAAVLGARGRITENLGRAAFEASGAVTADLESVTRAHVDVFVTFGGAAGHPIWARSARWTSPCRRLVDEALDAGEEPLGESLTGRRDRVLMRPGRWPAPAPARTTSARPACTSPASSRRACVASTEL